MSPFWNWFWHGFAFVFAMLFALPSFAIRKIVTRTSLHRPINVSDVAAVTWHGSPLRENQKSDIITAFNQSIFLQRSRDGIIGEQSPLVILLGSGVEYRIFPSAKEVYVIRTRSGRSVAYEVRSDALRAWFEQPTSRLSSS